MMSRAVAYLNTDMCVSGPDLDATASPALKSVLEEAAKNIPYPGEGEGGEMGERSYYDYWRGGPAPGCDWLWHLLVAVDKMKIVSHTGCPLPL